MVCGRSRRQPLPRAGLTGKNSARSCPYACSSGSDRRGDRMAMRERTARRSGAITFHHPGAFWFGISAATVGTLLTLPQYWAARHTCKLVPTTVPGSPLVKQCFVLAGKGVDGAMAFGMALILIGIAATFYGLFPRLSEVSRGYISRIRVRAMDDAPLRPAHVALLLVMAVAVTIDI